MKFRYYNPTVLYFGEDYLSEKLVDEILAYGREILLVYGQGNIKKNGLFTDVMNLLLRPNFLVHELSGVRPNAYLEHVQRGIEICRENNITLILAIGGGSVIDTCKAIAAGAKYNGDAWEFFNGNCSINDALPIGTVLTTAGTGSEMNPFAVIYNENAKVKRLVASEHLYPRFSFCLPSVTISVPLKQVAFGIIDMFTHVLETYVTLSSDQVVQRRIEEALLQSIVECGSKALEDSNNIQLRETLMYCSTLALNGMTSMGAVGDWSTHSIVDEIAGFYDVPHGALLAVVLPAWLEYVQECSIAVLCKIGTSAFSITKTSTQRAQAQESIRAVRLFFKNLGAPVCLSELGITDTYFETIAERVIQNGPIGKIKPLYQLDVLNILYTSL